MICANPNCNKEIIGRRSDAHSCSIECSKKVKWIREKAKNIDRSEYIRQHYFNNKEKIKKRLKEYEFKNKERIASRVKLQRFRDAEQYKKRLKEAKKDIKKKIEKDIFC